MTDGDLSDAQRLEIIRAILAEPVPRWFQNAHRRANSYAEQLQRIAEVAFEGARGSPRR
jgi:hypothetical protein